MQIILTDKETEKAFELLDELLEEYNIPNKNQKTVLLKLMA